MSEKSSRPRSVLRWTRAGVGVCLLGAIAGVGYRWSLDRVRTDIYSERLAGLSAEYESLRSLYNEAVRRTAVTELIVKDGRLSLAIRTMEGLHRVIETSLDPSQEIYCDYLLVGGRLWIRRVYDAQTPPSRGVVIDDELATVDWNDPAVRYGKAVYRSLSEGRWIVTVTGDGSLGLAKIDEDTEVELQGPPPVRDYEQIVKQIRDEIARVTAGDLLRRVLWPGE